MATVRTSAFEFVRGLGGAILAGLSALTDPLSVAKMTGLVDPHMHWILGPVAMRYLFGTIAIVWAFVWYHGVRKQMDRGLREPNMPLHQVCRWIARDSVWAAKYRWADDEWVTRVGGEFFSKWQLGRFEIMGKERISAGMTYLPPAMKESSHFETHQLVHDRPPHIILGPARPNGVQWQFNEIKLDRQEVERTWPKRSLLNRIKHKSPIERIGARGYEEISGNKMRGMRSTMANWRERFDTLLKGMASGEPHKPSARKSAAADQAPGAAAFSFGPQPKLR